MVANKPASDRGGKLLSAGGRHKVTFRHWIHTLLDKKVPSRIIAFSGLERFSLKEQRKSSKTEHTA